MLKWLLTFITLITLCFFTILVIRPPDRIKTRVVNFVAKKYSASIPYDIVIERVSGSPWSGLSFTDVRLLEKSSHTELLRFEKIDIKMSWPELLFHKIVHLDAKGQLENGPFVLNGQWTPHGILHFDVNWEKAGLGSALVHMSGNIGTFHVQVDSPRFKGSVQGQANLLLRSIQGHGSMKTIVWQGKRLDGAHFSFSANAQNQRLEATTGRFQLQENTEKPYDMDSVRLSIHGNSPRWRTAASLKFRDGSTTELRGRLVRGDNLWRLDWQRLAVFFPSAGTWTSVREGSILWQAKLGIEIHHLSLANGAQTMQIPHAVLDQKMYLLDFMVNDLDPTPWVKWATTDVSLNGTLNASVHLRKTASHVEVDGFVNGKFKSLDITSIGLALQNIDIDLRSVKGKIHVEHFVAQMKKGDIQITGTSTLPQLDYALHARNLALQPIPQTQGRGNIDLSLRGSLESPILTGQVSIAEATYTVPKKEKKQKPSRLTTVVSSPERRHVTPTESHGTLDIVIEWPRNVWYRDGISRIETRGDVRVQKHDGSSNVILSGSITSIRGFYNYFGRDFNLESGEIKFTGSPDNNPVLAIEASYATGAATVYLDITGTPKAPVLKMHSNPPLPDEDIISVIVFGQPLSELRSRTGGTPGNQEMMQAVGGVLGSYLSKGLNQTGIPALNFDILNIQPADQGGSQLTLGRYLSRKLFISYGQTVQGSAEKSITADYFLTDKWTLQGASDSTEGNYMDFLFRYPLNKKGSPANNSPLPTSPFRQTLDQPAAQQPSFRVPMQ